MVAGPPTLVEEVLGWVTRKLGRRKRQEFAHDPLPPSIAPPTGSVSRFLLEHITAVRGAETPIDTLTKSYAPWCKERGLQPLPTNTMLEEMARLFEKAGVKVRVKKNRLYAIDVDFT